MLERKIQKSKACLEIFLYPLSIQIELSLS